MREYSPCAHQFNYNLDSVTKTAMAIVASFLMFTLTLDWIHLRFYRVHRPKIL